MIFIASNKMVKERAPIFSDSRYQKELEERNIRMEIKRKEREDELQLKELLEAEELAKRQMHKSG